MRIHPPPKKNIPHHPWGSVSVNTFFGFDCVQMSGASRKPVLVVPPVAAGGFNLRRPLRITITVSWSVYQALVTSSDQQGRSLSNLAAYWLERQAESPRDIP